MAEDKMNTGPEDQVPGEGETTVTPPETAGGGPPVQEDGEVVINIDTIDRLMAERRAAAREEVEQGDAASDLPGPEEKPEASDPPLPGDGDNAAPVQEETELPGEDDPTPKAGGTDAKVIDFAAIDGEDHREPWEKTQDELDAEQGKKPRRGRPPKDKDGSQAEKNGKPRKGRQPKADRAAPKQGKGERDKVSQGKDGKGPEVPAAGGGPGSAPAAELYGDNVIEKHGINRDSTGDREKTRYLCGKQGIFTRDRALIRPGFIRQLETRASTRSASFFHALGSPGRPHNGGGEAGAYRTRNGAKPLKQGHLRAKRGPLGPSRKSQQQTKRTGFAAHGHSIAETAPEGKRASCANGALIRA